MPNFGDDIYVGTVVAGGAVSAGPSPMTAGVGPLGRVYMYDIVPATLLANGIATSQNPTSGSSFTLTAGAGTTSVVRADGTTVISLDVPRCVSITAAGANSAIYRISGYDVYGQPMTQLLAAPSTSTVTTTKAFKQVSAVTNTNATAGTNGLTVGFVDVFGLPVVVADIAYVVAVKWASLLPDNTATVVVADATTPATASTGDVRGTVAQSGVPSNGVRRLVVSITTPAAVAGPSAVRVGAFGVTQV